MKITATPEKGVLSINLAQRLLGRAVDLNVDAVGQASRDLCADSFWAYFLKSPKLIEQEEVPESRSLNWILMNWVMSSPSWDSSRLEATGRMGLAVVCAQILYEYLMSDSVIREALEQQDKMEESADAGNSGGMPNENQDKDDTSKSSKPSEENEDGEGGEDGSGGIESSQDDQNRKEEIKKRLDTIGLRAIRAQAIDKANQTATEVEAMCRAFGQEISQVTVEDVRAIVEMSKRIDKVPEMIDLMGRSKGVAMESYKRRVSHVLTSIGYTQNPQSILASEVATLSKSVSPYLRAVKASEFSERGLMGFVCEKEGERHGGLVIGIDDSGSMSGAFSLRAKSLALGMCQAAYASQQDWTAFMFSDERTPIVSVDSKDSIASILKFISTNYGGGTSFNKALDFAISKIVSLGEKAHEWDIIILTDGQCYLSEESIEKYKEIKERYGCRLIWLSVSGETDSTYWTDIRRVSTAIVNASKDTKPEDIAKTLSQILCNIA